MKITVLGCRGMLGTDLVKAAQAGGVEVAGFDLPEIDVTRKDPGLDALPGADWVVNCIGYTNVDGAEKDRDKAFAVNAEGTRRIAAWCAERAMPFFHVSTDYVFDGELSRPYREDDPTHPLSVYGESKLAGEKAVEEVSPHHIIMRTQSLFGIHGPSFVKAIMNKLAQGQEPLRVVDDQFSSPTYTAHLADSILRLLNCGREGRVHVSSTGSCSWYEFAVEIVRRANPGVEVLRAKAADYGRPAKRPANAVLDKARYAAWTGHEMPTWKQALTDYLSDSLKQGTTGKDC